MPVEDRWNERNGSPRRIADGEAPDTGSRPGTGVKREEQINDDRDRYLAAPRQSAFRPGPQEQPPRTGSAQRMPRADARANAQVTTQPMASTWQGGEPANGRSSGHAGKGPKGYSRSDERLLEAVCERLEEDARLDASDITVTVRDAEVLLEGTVPDRESKHRAEDLAAAVGGVQEVQNHLRARKGSSR